jgi:hypothetical protein
MERRKMTNYLLTQAMLEREWQSLHASYGIIPCVTGVPFLTEEQAKWSLDDVSAHVLVPALGRLYPHVVRGTTHGDFSANAAFALQYRDLLRSMKPHWSNLSPKQALALDEIGLKIARIVSGGHNTKDSWKDIAGYAQLGEKACS